MMARTEPENVQAQKMFYTLAINRGHELVLDVIPD